MEVLCDVDATRIGELRHRDEFFWLDLEDPPNAILDRAGALLELHPLALEDSREFGQRAKLDRYRNTVLLVYWTARVTPNGLATELLEVHLHVSGGFLLTVRRGPCPELEALHEGLGPEDAGHEEYLVYHVLDALTDALYPVIDHIEARLDGLEGRVLGGADRRQLSDIYRLRQDVQQLLRRLLPQRDHFAATAEAILSLPGLERGTGHYLRDVGDHLAQVTGELHRQADDLSELTSTYFAANGNRLNRLATRLTVLATFFLIWTLVTSFFGQNFGWLIRHIDSFTAFAVYEAIGLLLPTVGAAVFFWRRRREWL